MVDMFANNRNAPSRHHRQAPVSSGAAFNVVSDYVIDPTHIRGLM